MENNHAHHEEKEGFEWLSIVRIFISGITALLLVFLKLNSTVCLVLALVAYVIISYETIINALKEIFLEKEFFNEDLLMTVASIGAFAIGKYEEAIFIMLLNEIGEILEHVSVEKSRKSILKTIDLRAKIAHKVADNNLEDVDPSTLEIGDTILIKTGDLVPVDCVVIEGNALIDSSSMTGEFIPVKATSNVNLISGTVLTEGSVTCKVTQIYENSTAAKTLELIEKSEDNKSKSEQFITKFSKIYTPVIFAIAFLLFIIPTIISTDNAAKFGYVSLMFLVISCPCAIVISVPLAYFLGIGQCAKNGVIVKGANYLERMNDIDTFVFDKTGTLTKGKISVSNLEINGDKEEILTRICAAESCSNHPIAVAVVNSFRSNFDTNLISDIKEISGMGITIRYGKDLVAVGNKKLLKNQGFDCENIPEKDIFVIINGHFVASFDINDQVKEGTKEFIDYLKKNNTHTLMLTGDKTENASAIADKVGIANFKAELLPNEKFEALKKTKKESKCTAYIGDGINDAPSIKSADLGFAVGGVGSDIAVENADIVLLSDDLNSIAKSLRIAKKTKRVAIFNIVFALLLKFLLLGVSFLTNQLWVAVLGDVGLSLLLVVSTMLSIKNKKIKK